MVSGRRHPHLDLNSIGPGFGGQRELGVQGGVERIRDSVEGGAEGITHRLEDVPIIVLPSRE